MTTPQSPLFNEHALNAIIIEANITQPENIPAGAVICIGNAYTLPNPPPFAGTPQMPTAADYLRLAQSGRYPATAAEHTNLLYIRDKVALTAAEQLAKKVQAAF